MRWWVTRKELDSHKEWMREKREELSARLEARDGQMMRLWGDFAQFKEFINTLKQERHDARVRAEYANELLDDTRRVETEQELIAALHDKMKGKR